MIALQIVSMKQFMTQLLISDVFDIFLLREATISTANNFTIDGRLNRDFYSPEELASGQIPAYEFTPWSQLKGLCFQLIKGRHTPLSFKFILHLKPEIAEKLLKREGCSVDPSQLDALVLTIRYDGAKTVLTTGTATRTFLLSKEPDQIWDRTLSKYLEQKGISTRLL